MFIMDAIAKKLLFDLKKILVTWKSANFTVWIQKSNPTKLQAGCQGINRKRINSSWMRLF